MVVKTYEIFTSKGVQAGTSEAKWTSNGLGDSTIEAARESLAALFQWKLDREDRGEDYEREWDELIERAEEANVGDVLCFDEFAAKIVEVSEVTER